MIISGTIETIRTIYKELFTIKFVHTGYDFPNPSVISENIIIEPDKDTKQFFDNFNISYRFSSDTFLCFLRTRLVTPPAREPQKVYLKFIGDVRLRFLIKSGTGFLKKTYVVTAGSKLVYQFSNKIKNTLPATPGTPAIAFLSKKIELHSIAKDYQGGTIVSKGGQLYASLKSVLAADSIPETNTDFWKPIGPMEQLVNNADLEPVEIAEADEKCFGVIDIYNTGTISNMYDLFEAGPDQKLRSPVYTIPFKLK